MIAARDIAFGLFGAWRLAHFDSSGMQYVDDTVEGFWKSFFAAVIALPGYGALRAIAMVSNPEALPTASWPRTVAVFAIAYVIAWTSFPVVMTVVAEILDRRDQFIRLIVAYNWSAVIQVAVLLPVAVLVAAGGGGASVLLYFAVMAAIMVYLWFIVRTALDVPGPTAAALVGLDFVINLLINGVVDVMVTG